jgi:YYY domain-containing protein
MLTVIIWWLWIQIIGLAALPLAFCFLRRLPDRGYAFARPLGLLLSSYVLWIGSSLGFLRNSVGGAILSILALAALSLAVYWRSRKGSEARGPGLLTWLRQNHRLVLGTEALFVVAFGLWALMRAYSPDLTTAGGEKFMEIMYLNSIGRSDYFPPHDAWLSGYAISYYHFGYIMIAMLTRLSGLPAHLTFNVGVALLFALTCTGAFGIVYNLVRTFTQQPAAQQERAGRPLLWGYLGALLVAVMGNLEGFLEVLYSLRALPEGFWRWLDIKDINQPFNPEMGASLMPARSGWWWWRASRVIHDLDPAGNSMGVQPIDEFPGFSFLLGDMHPHVLALPFVLLILAVAFHTFIDRDEQPAGGGWLAPITRISPLVALCIGSLLFLNTWDFPIYFLILVGAYGLRRWPKYGQWSRDFLYDVGATGAGIAILGGVFYLPFFIGFQSQAGGLLPTLYVGTRFRQYFVMFGPFLVAIGGLLVGLAVRTGRSRSRAGLLRRWLGWTALYLLAPLAIMFLMAAGMLLFPQGREFLEGIRSVPFVYEIVGDAPLTSVLLQLLEVKVRAWVMPLVVSGMAAIGTVLLLQSAGTFKREDDNERESDAGSPTNGGLQASIRFALLMALAGLLATLSVEFVYLVDHFRVRANTIFKFYFQAWVLMALASAFAVYWLSRRKAWWRAIFVTGFWILVLMGMVYPILGNITRAGSFASAPTLDGSAYLAHTRPDDYEAITWLNENVEGRPVILEAPGSGGSSYVYEGRVSALTGLPTLLGWGGHENQWRGNYDIQSAREPDIQTIYNSLDPWDAIPLLEQYEVTYVFVGPVERGRYDQQALAKFAQFMDIVYQKGDVTIYKMR